MRRAYDLLRAYVGREWERIESVFEQDARKELNDYLDHRSREGVEESPPPPPTQASKQSAQEMEEGLAYQVLGLDRNASLTDLKRAYKRLSERSLPANFPEGSEERKKAAEVHLRVQQAYDILLPKLDTRLRRFRSLDIEK